MQDNISNFKILSIDGGGIRGVIPAKILCDLEEEAIKKDGPEAVSATILIWFVVPVLEELLLLGSHLV
ncbi:hypothetical protein ACIXNM_07260 [Bacteroides fragilis]